MPDSPRSNKLGSPKGKRPKGGRPGMDLQSSRWVLYVLAVVVILALVSWTQKAMIGGHTKTYENWTEFMVDVKRDRILTLAVNERSYSGKFREGMVRVDDSSKESYEKFRVSGPIWDHIYPDHKKIINDKAVEVSFPQPSQFLTFLGVIAPWLLLFGLLWFFFFRHMRGAGGPGSVLSFGKSRASLVTKENSTKSFADVAGIEEAKEEVEEIIDFLRNPKKYERLGGRIPRGVLLIGAPGTGKTLLAKAIAGEADVPFYSISGSDFVEMFVGVGASRVRDLFQQARDNAPCIIFLDEIDAVGRRRGTGLGGGHDEREQTLNAILVEMDGFERDENIIMMAATNRPDVLDPALLRPGRFDRHIHIDAPDIRGREAILKVHAKKVKLAESVDLKDIAKGSSGFSGADLENLINEAALVAVKKERDAIASEDLEEARDKVLWGREKKSRVISEDERQTTAYHESGHALVGYLLEETDRPHKVTIIPRGPSLGATSFLPEHDIYNMTRRRLLGEIKVLLAGRISELMFCDDISTGAKNDIERATNLAKRMVCEWGMSDAIGPVNYSDEEEHLFLGREITRHRDHSEETSRLIDQEIRGIIDACHAAAQKLLEDHRDDIRRIAEALLEREVLSGDNLKHLLQGKPLERLPSDHPRAGPDKPEPADHADAERDGEPASPTLETAGDQSGRAHD